MFHPTREENKATLLLVVKLGEESATHLIKEMLDPTKLTSQHISREGGRLSWKNTTQQEYEDSTGKEATNENEQIPFGSLTSKLEIFSIIGINHYSDLALARYNKDFYRNEVELCKRSKKKKIAAPIGEHGNFFNLDFPMSQSIFQIALQSSTGVRKAGRNATETQSEKKREKNKHFLKSVSKVPPRDT